MMRHSPLRHAGALLWKRRPLHLTFFVTRRCDARCDFCFSRGRTAAEGPELSVAEIARLAPTVGPLLWLSYSGGEPTLREDLPEITAIFARHCRPVIVLLSTNGLDPQRTASSRWTARRRFTTACAAYPGHTPAFWRASGYCGS